MRNAGKLPRGVLLVANQMAEAMVVVLTITHWTRTIGRVQITIEDNGPIDLSADSALAAPTTTVSPVPHLRGER